MTTQYPSRARSKTEKSVQVMAEMRQDRERTVTPIAIVDRLVKDVQNRSVVNNARRDSVNSLGVELRFDIELADIGGLGHSSGGHLDVD